MKTKKVVLNMDKENELSNDQLIIAHYFHLLDEGVLAIVKTLFESNLKETSFDSIIDSCCHQLMMLCAFIPIYYKKENNQTLGSYMRRISRSASIETVKLLNLVNGGNK